MLNVGSELREKEGDYPTEVDHRPAPWPPDTLLSTMTDNIPLNSKARHCLILDRVVARQGTGNCHPPHFLATPPEWPKVLALQ